MTISRAVVLVGSAKPAATSTSEALTRYLVSRLQEGGVSTEIVPIVQTRTAAGAARLVAAIASADLFMLASPLYVDSLPYLVTRAFEGLASARQPASAPPRCRFAALVNCGFPESRQCQTALAIARAFARRAGFEWAGGLALGGGAAIDGRPLQDLGGMGRHLRAALDLAASALCEGQPVPDEAVSRMARPLLPSSIYTFMGNVGWRRQARRNGVRRQLAARPFAR